MIDGGMEPLEVSRYLYVGLGLAFANWELFVVLNRWRRSTDWELLIKSDSLWEYNTRLRESEMDLHGWNLNAKPQKQS